LDFRPIWSYCAFQFSNAGLVLDPVDVVGNVGVDSGQLRPGAGDTPADDADEDTLAVLEKTGTDVKIFEKVSPKNLELKIGEKNWRKNW
jgi:hypothetical protein